MKGHIAIARLAGILLLLGFALPSTAPSLAQGTSRTFPETGKTVSGKFLQYWDSHGGLAQQGYPISEEMQEVSETDGQTYTVQYFERSVFEMHPENQPPYDVLLQLLGVFYYDQKYLEGTPDETPNDEPGAINFEETGQTLGGVFLEYWRSHGGLAQQGYPISDEFQERNDLDGKTYKVQYFERAVFELHPENRPPYNVLLSQLGTFRYKAKYGGGPGPGPGPPPTATAVPAPAPTAIANPTAPVIATPTTPAGAGHALITSHDPVPQPSLAKPALGASVTDPAFGTRIVRITDSRSTEYQGIVPEYSKRQAWNADESLLLLRTGDGSTLLYDGKTYAFKKNLMEVGGDDVFWDPKNPALLYYNPGNTLHSYDVNTDVSSVLGSFSEYAFAHSMAEGNLSRDGRWYALVGRMYDEATGEVSIKDLLVFDMTTRQVTARLAMPPHPEDFDWVSISPLGNYVVVNYATAKEGRYNGVEVYDRNLNFVWQKPLGPGHSDLGVGANGEEYLVAGMYDEERNVHVIWKFRLSDGQQTALMEYSWAFHSHISCRSEQRPGWCVVSTYDGEGRLTDDTESWLPFEDEIFLLKTDGSGDVQRLAHHYSRRFSPTTPDGDTSVYWAEPHATISHNGDRILFGSNWRQGVEQPASVDSYIVDLR